MMFEESPEEIAENNAFLKAIEERAISLEILNELPAYSELKDFEQQLKDDGALSFASVFGEQLGFYFLKQFLISEYAGEKAVFLKDVEHYKSMRFQSARRRVARLIYQRYVAEETQDLIHFPKDMKNDSTFLIMQRWKKEASEDKGNPPDDPDDDDPSTGDMDLTVSRAPTHPGLRIGNTNAIGVYGSSVETVQRRIQRHAAPQDLFDEVALEVLNDLRMDVYPRFLRSTFYKKYIRTKWMETRLASVMDFTTFRVLGRGGFGSVHACAKKNSGALYAMKLIAKKLVKVKNALNNVMDERDVLTMIHSRFVTNIKYSFQDEDYLYIVMDLMLGGDLKFHLINDGRFELERARFYAAEVLLGLEHLHSLNIIYRDLKLENVLLDSEGHVKLSDLGLAVVSKHKVKGYAGTPGYTAPEMVAGKSYGTSADIFSFGVLLYRMLCGSKPFKARQVDDLDKAVLLKEPRYPPDYFPAAAADLLRGVLQKRPELRLGAGPRGLEEIKEHPFFGKIDWGLLEAGYVDPPFVPRKDINAAPAKDIGDFNLEKYGHVRLGERFQRTVKHFDFVSKYAVREELVTVLQEADKNVNFERFATQATEHSHGNTRTLGSSGCCVIL